MKKILLIIVGLVVVLGSWMFLKNKEEVAINTPTPSVSPEPTTSPSPDISKNVVTYTDSGYKPNTITIKKGETVVWKNESSSQMWTASAIHPTHKAYPGTDISLCGAQTLIAISMFDSCAGVVSGQSWSFKFDNVGIWGYHNHLNSSKFGKVVVE